MIQSAQGKAGAMLSHNIVCCLQNARSSLDSTRFVKKSDNCDILYLAAVKGIDTIRVTAKRTEWI